MKHYKSIIRCNNINDFINTDGVAEFKKMIYVKKLLGSNLIELKRIRFDFLDYRGIEGAYYRDYTIIGDK